MPFCPVCGSSNSIPIVYGRPSEELIEMAERGEVILGGCIPSEYHYKCKDCEHLFE